MTLGELQTYVDDHIPIVTANRFTFLSADLEKVAVGGTLADHINHRDSAFGGSLSTALILAAWARVRMWTETFEPGVVIVISEQTVRFTRPVLADFAAVTKPIDPEVLNRAKRLLDRFGKARFTVAADIVHRGDTQSRAEMEGEFVVVVPGH